MLVTVDFDAERFQTWLLSAFPLVNQHPDVAGVLRDRELLGLLGRAMAAPFSEASITKVCAPEARGPIVGALVAVELGAGLVLARKDERNHPGADTRTESEPTWRGEREVFLTRSFDFEADDVVLIADDWITSGNSIRAVVAAIEAAGARYAGASVIVNKADSATTDELRVRWLVSFDELMRSDRSPG